MGGGEGWGKIAVEKRRPINQVKRNQINKTHILVLVYAADLTWRNEESTEKQTHC